MPSSFVLRDAFSINSNFDLVLTITETAFSASAGTSNISWTLQIDPKASNTSYNLFSNPYSVVIAGQTWSGNYSYDFRTNPTTTRTIASGSKSNIAHATNGTLSFSASMSADDGGGPLGAASKSGTMSSPTYLTAWPSAPSSISTTRVGRDVTVTVGASTYDGGTAISSYTVQMNDGTGWNTSQVVSAGSTTFTGLSAATTYQFRAYATNAQTNSLYSSTATVYVPAGGKRYNGTSFISTTSAKRWNGTAWVDIQTAKRWNGSSWVDLS